MPTASSCADEDGVSASPAELIPIWDYTRAVRVISKATLSHFWARHPDARLPLQTWHADTLRALWKSPQDIRLRYASASFVGNNRVVFNIKGNDYRLVVAVAYRYAAVYLKFVGTHAEYDAIDAATVE